MSVRRLSVPPLSNPSISVKTFQDFPGKGFLDLIMSENRLDDARFWFEIASCHPQFTYKIQALHPTSSVLRIVLGGR